MYEMYRSKHTCDLLLIFRCVNSNLNRLFDFLCESSCFSTVIIYILYVLWFDLGEKNSLKKSAERTKQRKMCRNKVIGR